MGALVASPCGHCERGAGDAAGVDAATRFCAEDGRRRDVSGGGRRKLPLWAGRDDHDCEELMSELFRLHDLNKDGLLSEGELIQLNKKIAMLHYGRDVDTTVVRNKYHTLFRTRLDTEGRPVDYAAFRRYMLEVLCALESCDLGRRMILEQFIVEAAAARAAFHDPTWESASDAAFLPSISFDEELLCGPPDDEVSLAGELGVDGFGDPAASPDGWGCGSIWPGCSDREEELASARVLEESRCGPFVHESRPFDLPRPSLKGCATFEAADGGLTEASTDDACSTPRSTSVGSSRTVRSIAAAADVVGCAPGRCPPSPERCRASSGHVAGTAFHACSDGSGTIKL